MAADKVPVIKQPWKVENFSGEVRNQERFYFPTISLHIN
jgi:hypothetical protein